MYRPILFNTEMVKAILDGRKTQTRRLVKPNFREGEYGFWIITNTHTGEFVRIEYYDEFENETRWMKQPCEVGDVLWVRETFDNVAAGYPWYYKADGDLRPECWKGERWMPSIHMPKAAARIFLRVKDVRAERLQTIDGYGILAEGVDNGVSNPAMGKRWENMQRDAFEKLWNSTMKPADLTESGWSANPWVWVITFERSEKYEDFKTI